VHKAAKWAPGTTTVSVYYVCTTGQVKRKNKFGPRALVITRGQTVPGDMSRPKIGLHELTCKHYEKID